jgi:hypothetical protein
VVQKEEDGISLYSGEFQSSHAKSTSYSTHTYMLLPEYEEVVEIEFSIGTGTNFKMGFYKVFKRKMEYYLKDICPELPLILLKNSIKKKVFC